MREVEFERIDGRIDAELGDLAAEHRGGVQVRERGGRRGVGQVVGGHVDRLNRGDRALLGRGDAFLEHAHLGGQGRLITHRRRNAAQQRRHFGAGLSETEDVVDEEQHVLALFVAEILGDGEAGEADAGAGAGRLVHLAIDERHLRTFAIELDDAGIDHFLVEVVALAGTLADAGEHRAAAMGLGDVVDQLLDEHRLADAGAAEQADLAALGVGREQVDDLDAGGKDFDLGRLFGEFRRGAMDRQHMLVTDRAALVDRLADHVDDAAQRGRPHRNHDRAAGVGDFLAARHAVGRIHGDGADLVLAEMLGDLEHQGLALIGRAQGRHDGRQIGVEVDVHDGAHHLRYRADIVLAHDLPRSLPDPQTASAPEMISMSSLVICAWRVRLIWIV